MSFSVSLYVKVVIFFFGNSETVISVAQFAPISRSFLAEIAEYPLNLLGKIENARLVCVHL